MPFEDGQFDLIYDRRGPTSIINHNRLLRLGGMILGIHTNVDKVKVRLMEKGYQEIEIEEYNDSVTYFPNEQEFAKFLSDIPGNPDYTKAELKEALEKKLNENIMNGRIGVREHKFIWRAIKPGS